MAKSLLCLGPTERQWEPLGPMRDVQRFTTLEGNVALCGKKQRVSPEVRSWSWVDPTTSTIDSRPVWRGKNVTETPCGPAPSRVQGRRS